MSSRLQATPNIDGLKTLLIVGMKDCEMMSLSYCSVQSDYDNKLFGQTSSRN